MTDLMLNLSTEECEFLGTLLENVLKDTRIEEHRTRAPSFREHVLRDEDLIIGLLRKLGHKAD